MTEKENLPVVNKPTNANAELNRIPIAVSTNSVWYIEVSKEPKPDEIQKFLEMQKLMFS